MKLQDQVCTMEQAKRLKELGILHGCTYYYYEEIVNGRTSFPVKPLLVISDSCDNVLNEDLVEAMEGIVTNEIYPAPTVAELGQMLPSETYTERTGSEISNYPQWDWVNDGDDTANGLYDTEAHARAALLIHLLETNSLTAEEANKRLSQ